MKKLTFLMLSIVLLISCSSHEDINTPISSCTTQDYGITQNNKYSVWFQSTPSSSNTVQDTLHKWQWRLQGDTLTISGFRGTDSYSESYTQFFFKKTRNCVEFLFKRDISFGDTMEVDGDGLAHIPGQYYNTSVNNEFFLQEFSNQKMACKVGNFMYDKFWVEFTSENQKIGPYWYETFLRLN